MIKLSFKNPSFTLNRILAIFYLVCLPLLHAPGGCIDAGIYRATLDYYHFKDYPKNKYR